jgi:hypothetical protein
MCVRRNTERLRALCIGKMEYVILFAVQAVALMTSKGLLV